MVSRVSVARWLFWIGVVLSVGALIDTNPILEPGPFIFAFVFFMSPYTYHLAKVRYGGGVDPASADSDSSNI